MHILWRAFGLAVVALAWPLTQADTSQSPASPSPSSQAAVSVLHAFPNPTWIENMAVRASGEILATRLQPGPAVYQVDPTTGEALLVHAWNSSEYFGCLGITETTQDVFYVVLAAFVDDDFAWTSGVNSIFRVDMSAFSVGPHGSSAAVSKLIDIPEADFLNGMTTVDNSHILVADCYNGNVYRIDTSAATYEMVLDDPLMKYSYAVDPPAHMGVNGLKIYDGHLYWTNWAAGLLARIPIDNSGRAIGNASVAVANIPRSDDFIIRSDGTAFLCQNQLDMLSMARLQADKTVQAAPLAGDNISTTLAGVTAAQFGRRNDVQTLYLSTNGGLGNPINGTVTVAGTVSYIDTSAL